MKSFYCELFYVGNNNWVFFQAQRFNVYEITVGLQVYYPFVKALVREA